MKSFDDVINEEYGGYELYDKYKGKAGDTLEQRMLLDIMKKLDELEEQITNLPR